MSEQEKAPDRIWLQRTTPHRLEWTWHWEPIGEDDMEETEYVRADLALLQPEGEPLGYVSERDVEAMKNRKAQVVHLWFGDAEDHRPVYLAPPAPETRERETVADACLRELNRSGTIYQQNKWRLSRRIADAILGSEESPKNETLDTDTRPSP